MVMWILLMKDIAIDMRYACSLCSYRALVFLALLAGSEFLPSQK